MGLQTKGDYFHHYNGARFLIYFKAGDAVWVKSKNTERETWYYGRVQQSTRNGTVRGVCFAYALHSPVFS